MDSFRVAYYFFAMSSFSLLPVVTGDDYVNVALGKPTRQKDTANGGYSGLAVDGDMRSIYEQGSCTHSATTDNTWWMVDLLRSYPVHSIAISNRNVACDRLQDFTIHVFNVRPNLEQFPQGVDTGQVCIRHPNDIKCYGPHTINCNEVTTGRYVSLWKSFASGLTICEFEVFAAKHDVFLRQEMFSFRRGWKSLLTPFIHFQLSYKSSIIECTSMCMSAPGGVATVVQLEEATGQCQCVQKSEFDYSGSDTTLAEGWILVEATSN